MSNKKGKFITLEGGEGVGKSTNVPFIKHYIEARGVNVVTTREPGGTSLAEKIRDLLLQRHDEALTKEAEILLVFAARAQHLNQVIKPALAQGSWVLCDRFTDATYAYQGGGRGIESDAINWLQRFVQNDLSPDLTLLLDLPVAAGMARAKNRGGEADRFEAEQIQFFEQVRSNYLHLAAAFPGRIKLIEANRSLETVQQEMAKHIDIMLEK